MVEIIEKAQPEPESEVMPVANGTSTTESPEKETTIVATAPSVAGGAAPLSEAERFDSAVDTSAQERAQAIAEKYPQHFIHCDLDDELAAEIATALTEAERRGAEKMRERAIREVDGYEVAISGVREGIKRRIPALSPDGGDSAV